MQKSEAEQRVESATFGAMLILLGVTALIPNEGDWLFPLVAAVILLGSALYQRSQGWHISGATWVFGMLFAIAAVLELTGGILDPLADNWFALLLIILGGYMLVRVFAGRRG